MNNKEAGNGLLACLPTPYFLLISISIVETFLVLPSSDWTVSDPILTSPILYPAFSILFSVICDTSTARPMLRPLALIVTVGWLANWIRVDVTYVMSGFLPMYIVS